MPYFVKYFLDKKYNVDVVISPWVNHIKTLNMFHNKRLRKFVFDPLGKKNFILKKISKYKYIFFNSEIIYYKGEISIFKYFPYLNSNREKIYYLQHHLEYIGKKDFKNHIVALADLPNNDKNLIVANAHYFGNIKITPKNKNVIKFIIIGEISEKRRDFNILIDAIDKLVNQGITNFHITHIGKGNINIPDNLRTYFSLKGYLDFKSMNKEIEFSDFFLALLNPEIETHNRYIKDGTSGTFQLVYGFLKPCIIHEYFANIHHFSSDNSIVYNSNENLYESMKMAINLSQEEYNNLQQNLKQHVNNIEQKSQDNLDKVFI